MKVWKEGDLTDFDFWSGAKDTMKELTKSEVETVQTCIEEVFPDGVSMTALNDFLWFEKDLIAEWLGFTDWDSLVSYHEEVESE